MALPVFLLVSERWGHPRDPGGKGAEGGATVDSSVRQRAGQASGRGAALARLLTSPARPDWEGGVFSAPLPPAATSPGRG